MTDERTLLREMAQRLADADPKLLDKAKAARANNEHRGDIELVREKLGTPLESTANEQLALETIVVRTGRPVLLVQDGDYRLEGPESDFWRDRLGQASVRAVMKRVIGAVGRVEVENHPGLTWVGTGWVIGDGLIVTNRHVAEEFATRSRSMFTFRRGVGGPLMSASMDFNEESGAADPREFKVLDILHIEDDAGVDMAILKIDKRSEGGLKLPDMLRLARNGSVEKQFVATVGYPAADSRIPDQDLVRRLFGDVYDVKRMAPGQIARPRDGLVLHDCSTLGGNSGSPIVDLANGDVVGLHFAGLFLRENRGVPAAAIKRVLERRNGGAIQRNVEASNPPKVEPALHSDVQTIRLDVTIPIEVSVKMGIARIVGAPTVSDPKVKTIDEAVQAAQAQLQSSPGVVAIHAGYVFRDGWITDEPAIVIAVEDRERVAGALPARLGGFAVEVRNAGPSDYVESRDLLETLEGLPHTTYTPPADVALEPVEEEMKITCHLCPDAGWPMLRDFLSETKKRLTIGMYDFTAPHIIKGIAAAVDRSPRKLTLVLGKKVSLGGGTKKFDLPEEEMREKFEQALGNRFDFEWASTGKNHRFASAYHIKVAVRDGKAFWMSSGNWQSSNQPDHELAKPADGWKLLMKHNREWNAVIENDTLAEQFEAFLKHDLAQAREDAAIEAAAGPMLEFFVEPPLELERVPAGTPKYFPPLVVQRAVKVQPLLTPDNYQQHVLDLIESAENEILFQNQSFSILGASGNDARYAALFDALLAKQQAGVNVRIIVRGEFDAEKTVERLKAHGFDTDHIRLQDRCHTKGIIVDRKVVLIGSHNWTNQGALVNRDASLIVHDTEIAQYFTEVFEFDWSKLARQSIPPQRRVRIADEREAPANAERVSAEALLLG
jgi:S1-C subfamily serine protease